MQCCRQSVNQQENIVCWKIRCCRKVGKENSAMNRFLRVLLTFTNVKEETSDGLSEQPSRCRQPDNRKKQILSPDLTTDHRRSRKNQTPNQDWHILGMGFLTPGEVLSLPLSDSLESRSLSSEDSGLHGSTAAGGCITLKTKTMWSATPVQERT